MKRDMDLIRKILLMLENESSGWAPSEIIIEDYTKDQIDYHSLLLIEAGLVAGEECAELGSEPSGFISRLTWEGHEFLESAKDSSRWREAKEVIGKAGGASLQVWSSVLVQLTLKSLGLA